MHKQRKRRRRADLEFRFGSFLISLSEGPPDNSIQREFNGKAAYSARTTGTSLSTYTPVQLIAYSRQRKAKKKTTALALIETIVHYSF